MHSKAWIIVTVLLCLVFAALAFPLFKEAKGTATAIVYTLIGFAVIWFAYYARAWVFTRPGFRNGKDAGKGSV